MNQTIIDHIRATTPKGSRNHRRRTRRDEIVSDLTTAFAALVGVTSIIYIAYHLAK